MFNAVPYLSSYIVISMISKDRIVSGQMLTSSCCLGTRNVHLASFAVNFIQLILLHFVWRAIAKSCMGVERGRPRGVWNEAEGVVCYAAAMTPVIHLAPQWHECQVDSGQNVTMDPRDVSCEANPNPRDVTTSKVVCVSG